MLADGSRLYLLGGDLGGGRRGEDVWALTITSGAWERVTELAPWGARAGHAVVALGSRLLLLMGGALSSGARMNDVWRLATDGQDDDDATWERVRAHSEWTSRAGHAALVHPSGRIVLFGGFADTAIHYSGARVFNDVWGSESDGQVWDAVRADSPWTGRVAHMCVVHPSGYVLVICGRDGAGLRDDIWRSGDSGATWSQLAPAPWGPRGAHASVVLPRGDIIVTGGEDGRVENKEVWRSLNGGQSWTLIAHAEWHGRLWHTSVALPNGDVWVLGGRVADASVFFNDVWVSSTAGVSWHQATANGTWHPRSGHTTVALPSGEVLLLGGWAGGMVHFADVWCSAGGAVWQLITDSAPWGLRRGHTSVVRGTNEVFVIGGYNGIVYFNDVWVSSADATHWSCVRASSPWLSRSWHQTVVLLNGDLLILGGFSASHLNDAWLSRDGGHAWSQVRRGPSTSAVVAFAVVDDSTAVQAQFPISEHSVVAVPISATHNAGSGVDGAWAAVPNGGDGGDGIPVGATHSASTGAYVGPGHFALIVCGGQSAVTLAKLQFCAAVSRSSARALCSGELCSWSPRSNALLMRWSGLQAFAGERADVLFLFGGEDDTGASQSDLWVSTTAAETWSLVTATAVGDARFGVGGGVLTVPALPCPPRTARIRLLLTGGMDASFRVHGDARGVDVCLDLEAAHATVLDRPLLSSEGGAGPRFLPTSLTLPDGRVCVVGGQRAYAAPLGDAWCTQNGSHWIRVAQSGGDAIAHGAGVGFLDASNDLLLIGGPSRAWASLAVDVVPRVETAVRPGGAVLVRWRGRRMAPALIDRVLLRCAGDPSQALALAEGVTGWEASLELGAQALQQCAAAHVEACVQANGGPAACTLPLRVSLRVAVEVLSHSPAVLGEPLAVRVVALDAQGAAGSQLSVAVHVIASAHQHHAVARPLNSDPPGSTQLGKTVHISVPLSAPLTANYSVRATVAGAAGLLAVAVASLPDVRCPAGWFLRDGTQCERCPAGHFLADPNRAGACQPCAAGSFAPQAGMSACQACPVATYAGPRSAACIECGSAMLTTLPGHVAASRAACICAAGFVVDESRAEADKMCLDCSSPAVSGIVCDAANLTLRHAVTVAGMWRGTHTQHLADECLQTAAACVGGRLAEQCAPGHAGVLCSRCLSGFARQSAGSGSLPCVECDAATRARSGLAMAFIALGALAVTYMLTSESGAVAMLVVVGAAASGLVALRAGCSWLCGRRRERGGGHRPPAHAAPGDGHQHYVSPLFATVSAQVEMVREHHAATQAHATTERKLALLRSAWLRPTVAFFQITAIASRYTSILAPEAFASRNPGAGARLVAWFEQLSLLDVQGAFAFGCILPGWDTTANQLVGATLSPMLLAACCYGAGRWQRSRASPSAAQRLWWLGMMGFVLMSTNAQVGTLSVFGCRKLHFDGDSYLITNTAVRCGGSDYVALALYAAAMAAVYCILWPIVAVMLLARFGGATAVRNQPVWISPLTSGLKPDHAPFEMIEQLQKVFTIATFVFLTNPTIGRTPIAAQAAAVIQVLTLCVMLWYDRFVSQQAKVLFIMTRISVTLVMVQLVAILSATRDNGGDVSWMESQGPLNVLRLAVPVAYIVTTYTTTGLSKRERARMVRSRPQGQAAGDLELPTMVPDTPGSPSSWALASRSPLHSAPSPARPRSAVMDPVPTPRSPAGTAPKPATKREAFFAEGVPVAKPMMATSLGTTRRPNLAISVAARASKARNVVAFHSGSPQPPKSATVGESLEVRGEKGSSSDC